MKKIFTAEEYINSLRNRDLNIYLQGEKVLEPADHPIIRPSINAMACSNTLANEARDLAGGLVATMPSEKEFNHPELKSLLLKYLKGKASIPSKERMKMLRLIENMTLGRNAVGYLTESLHGAGSPQAQRIQIGRFMQTEYKKRHAKILADIEDEKTKENLTDELTGYFSRVFQIAENEKL